MLVFATQNLIKDPPFSRLDLVSCRNVLIYMDTVLQKKIGRDAGFSNLDFEKPNGDIISLEFSGTVVKIGNRNYIQSFARDIAGRQKTKRNRRPG